MVWKLRPCGKEDLFVVDERSVIIAAVPKELEASWKDLVNQANQLFDKADILETRKKQMELKV